MEHWSQAPETIRRSIERARRETTIPSASGETLTIPAIGEESFARCAASRGYLVREDELRTPALDALAQLDARERAHFEATHALDLKYERRALQVVAAQRREAELRAARDAEERARAAEAARRDAIERRAAAILADEDARRLADARARAEAEFDGTPARRRAHREVA